MRNRRACSLVLPGTSVPMFCSHPKHLFQIAVLPALRIAKGNDHGTGFRDFWLAKCSLAQLFFLLTVTHHNKAPRLEVVPARCFQSGANNFFQVDCMDRHMLKTTGSAPLRDYLAQ